MQKLYDITGDYQRGLAEYQGQLDETEGALEAGEIDAEELEKRYDAAAGLYGDVLDLIGDDFATKAENIAKVIRNLEQDAEIHAAKAKPFEDEAARYRKRERTAKRQIAGLKTYLLQNLAMLDLKKVEGDELKVRRQNNGRPSVNVIHLDDVPEDYRIPQPDKIDSGKVVQDWRGNGKAEDMVPGLEIRLGQHVRIA